jgi:hypothetical protein
MRKIDGVHIDPDPHNIKQRCKDLITKWRSLLPMDQAAQKEGAISNVVTPITTTQHEQSSPRPEKPVTDVEMAIDHTFGDRSPIDQDTERSIL